MYQDGTGGADVLDYVHIGCVYFLGVVAVFKRGFVGRAVRMRRRGAWAVKAGD